MTLPKTRRRLFASSLSLSAAGLLAACGTSANTDGPAAGPANIPPGTTILYLGNHNAQEAQVVLPVMESFNGRIPNLKVDATNHGGSPYDEKLSSMLAAGTPPDMFRTGGTGWAQYANQGAMAEIGSRAKRDKFDLSDLIEAAVQQYFWKGKHIGLGSNVGYSLIYYNTAIFAEAGVPELSGDWAKATIWADYTEALKRVTKRGPDGEPTTFGFSGLDEFNRWMVTNGVTFTNPEETRTLYDTPEGIEVFEWMYDLVHAHKVAQNPLTHAQLSPVNAFKQGKAATWLSSTAGGTTQLVPEKDLPWNAAATPRGPKLKSETWIFGGGSAWWIAAGSKSVDGTWELLKFLESAESGKKFAQGGFAPIRYSVLNSPDWLRSDQPPKNKRVLVDGLKRLLPFPKLTNFSTFNSAINAEVQALWKGERRGREVAQRIRQATDPILAEHQAAIKSK